MKNICLVLLFALLAMPTLLAQGLPIAVGDTITVTLQNDKELQGKVISIDDQVLVLQRAGKNINIPIRRIAFYTNERGIPFSDENKVVDDKKESPYRYYPDQYFFLPSALPVNKGEIYYRNIMIVGHVFSFGVSDRFSLNAGFETISLFASGDVPAIWLTPKFNLPLSDNFHVGVGGTGFFYESESVAFLFSNMTIGNPRNHFSLGLGFGSDFNEVYDEPLVYAGWNVSILENISWVGEGFFFPTLLDDDFDDVLMDTSIRIKFKNNLAVDFGAFIAPGDGGAIPLLGLTIPIAEKK